MAVFCLGALTGGAIGGGEEWLSGGCARLCVRIWCASLLILWLLKVLKVLKGFKSFKSFKSFESFKFAKPTYMSSHIRPVLQRLRHGRGRLTFQSPETL